MYSCTFVEEERAIVYNSNSCFSWDLMRIKKKNELEGQQQIATRDLEEIYGTNTLIGCVVRFVERYEET